MGPNSLREKQESTDRQICLISKERCGNPWTAELVRILKKEIQGSTDGQISPKDQRTANLVQISKWVRI